MHLSTRILLLSVLMLLSCSTAWAQIQDEIKAYSRDSIKTEINNGRLLCLENVLKKDEVKTKEIIAYLEGLTKNTGFKAFTYYEYMAIYALLEDWTSWVGYARACDFELYKNFYPETVPIYGSIYEALFAQRDMLKLKMMASAMDQERKDMYAIYDEFNVYGSSVKYKELMRLLTY